MKLKDFKTKMQLGAKVKASVYWLENGEYKLKIEFPERSVSIVQSNSFAFNTWVENKQKFENSWCEWPKASDLTDMPDGKVQFTFEGGKMIYEFL